MPYGMLRNIGDRLSSIQIVSLTRSYLLIVTHALPVTSLLLRQVHTQHKQTCSVYCRDRSTPNTSKHAQSTVETGPHPTQANMHSLSMHGHESPCVCGAATRVVRQCSNTLPADGPVASQINCSLKVRVNHRKCI